MRDHEQSAHPNSEVVACFLVGLENACVRIPKGYQFSENIHHILEMKYMQLIGAIRDHMPISQTFQTFPNFSPRIEVLHYCSIFSTVKVTFNSICTGRIANR